MPAWLRPISKWASAVLAGNILANRLRLQLARNIVRVVGLNGTLINGLPAAVLRGVVRGLTASLRGGDDTLFVQGRLSGLIVLNGEAGNDRYVLGTVGSQVRVDDRLVPHLSSSIA